ncbi:hypothetical protein K3495_g5584 [Podosphaera aphanis]|nr:hypothetical protein K3495_g5584 [Podosphaera aphanis]
MGLTGFEPAFSCLEWGMCPSCPDQTLLGRTARTVYHTTIRPELNAHGTLKKKIVYGGYNSDLDPDDSERNFDSSLNIYRMAQYPEKQHTKNESERSVKSVWPEVRIASDLKGKGAQIKGLPDGAHKFKVYLDNS